MKSSISIIGPNKLINNVVSKKLAEELGLICVDTDELIEYTTGMSASEIIEKYGAERYYKLENDRINGLKHYENTVISTSSSTAMNPENYYALQSCTYTVLLYSSEDVALARIRADKSISLKADIMKRSKTLFNNIRSEYKPNCDISVDVTVMPPDKAVKQILRAFENLFKDL